MSLSTPTLDEWRRLYEAAVELKRQAPWEWMAEDEIFGVRNPETGETGYVSIMGANGEHLALAVYLGSEGLDGFWSLHNEEVDDPFFLLEVPQIQVSFEDRDVTRTSDRSVIKALGLKFRGKQEWPLFRSYVPGYDPWYLTRDEAHFLAVVIEQSLDVIQRLEKDPDLLEPPDDDKYLVRTQTEQGWADRWLEPEPTPRPAPPPLDTRRLETMRQQLRRGEVTLEAELFILPIHLQESKDSRPLLPYTLLIVEASSGFILAGEIVVATPSLDAVWEQALTRVLDTIDRMQILPQRIVVRGERLQNLLIPVSAALGIRLQMSSRLPALDEARNAMEHRMG
jgi:hypothetical protein